jgi:ABC-type nitrate/sulfonate/bicarbonate transport system ATPase subunit
LSIVLGMAPKILLTNEHFFSLEIQARLYKHSNTQGIILFVTYYVDEAVVLGDMIGTIHKICRYEERVCKSVTTTYHDLKN